jgi:hypothetical protein
VAVNDNERVHTSTEPHPKMVELAERLAGRWQIKGPGIDGKAQYKSLRGGLLLVMNVDFVVNGTEMKAIQHVSYHQETDTLRARYMDTMGDESTYTWVLEGQKLRVSLGDKESDTFFEATFDNNDREYAGTWHYPNDAGADAAEERIVYSRIE